MGRGRPSDLPLSAEERAAYLGMYQIGCTHLRVIEGDKHLVVESASRGRRRTSISNTRRKSSAHE